MTDQPKPGKDETPEGYQPPSVYSRTAGVRRSAAAGTPGARTRTSATQQFAQPEPPRQPESRSSRGQAAARHGPAAPRGQQPDAGTRPYGQRTCQYGQHRRRTRQHGRYGQQPYGAAAAVRPAGQPVQRLRPAGVLRRAAGTQGPEHRQPVLRHRRLGGAWVLPPAAARRRHPGAHGPQREPAGKGMAIAGLVMGYVGIAADHPGVVLIVVGLVIGTRNATGGVRGLGCRRARA